MEVAYRKSLLNIVKKLNQALELKELREEINKANKDSPLSEAEKVLKKLRKVSREMDQRAAKLSERFVKNASIKQKRMVSRQLKRDLSIDVGRILNDNKLRGMVRAKIKVNTNLIKSISQEYLQDVEQVIYSALSGNKKTSESLTERIRKIQKVTKNRAKLIARDQTSKAISAFNRARYEQLGVEEYVWETVGDERVRPTHEDNDGKTFRWDSPPEETGHPGEDIACRCNARPIFNLGS